MFRFFNSEEKADRFQRELNRERRNFLEMMGKMGVAPSIFKMSGLATAMLGARFAEAQNNNQKKFILIFHPNGSPNGKYLNGAAMNPFEAHKGDISAVEMTISDPGAHGNIWRAAGATSYRKAEINSSSVDVQAATVLNATAPKGTLHMGVESKDQAGINRDRGTAIGRYNRPMDAFDAVFGNGPVGGGGGNGDPAAPSVFDQRRSVLDIHKAGIEAIRKKLSQAEKDRLDLHAEAIASMERRLTSEEMLANGNNGGGDMGNGGGGACDGPNIGNPKSPLQTYKTQGDIAVAALKCGLTNVASIQFSETQASWYVNDGTPDAVNWNGDHHQANHGGGASKLPQIVGYMNKGVAHIVSELKKAGIFDQTVVCCFSEMGDGQGHSAGNGPIVVASGINGFKSVRRNVGGQHFKIYSDVFKLLGIQSAVGNTVFNYGNGGVVT